jgi:hypothetical protein
MVSCGVLTTVNVAGTASSDVTRTSETITGISSRREMAAAIWKAVEEQDRETAALALTDTLLHVIRHNAYDPAAMAVRLGGILARALDEAAECDRAALN